VPEGDTLWRTAAALRPRLLDRAVRRAWPQPLARLKGQRVVGIDANGKHLLMRFDGGLVLHSHMRMTGSWHIYAPGQRWRRPQHLARAVLEFDDVVAVAFSAPVVELIRDAGTRTGHLGPDILAEGFDASAACRLARLSDRVEVGDVLLDQRVCAGIGNIYKCETMWLHHVSPFTPVADIADADLAQLYLTARRLMLASATGSPAPRRRAVHARSGRPCPRCGDSIRTRPQGALARVTYFCPRCQAAR